MAGSTVKSRGSDVRPSTDKARPIRVFVTQGTRNSRCSVSAATSTQDSTKSPLSSSDRMVTQDVPSGRASVPLGNAILMDTATVGLRTRLDGRGQLISSAPRSDAWALSCRARRVASVRGKGSLPSSQVRCVSSVVVETRVVDGVVARVALRSSIVAPSITVVPLGKSRCASPPPGTAQLLVITPASVDPATQIRASRSCPATSSGSSCSTRTSTITAVVDGTQALSSGDWMRSSKAWAVSSTDASGRRRIAPGAATKS
mmetsp:Transcript_11958/g.35754  ORF Transcript_11958/g.35754 Transcript_11958/m.35754 type:complete len:259 (+) Transcript_11958:808-1584(+)